MAKALRTVGTIVGVAAGALLIATGVGAVAGSTLIAGSLSLAGLASAGIAASALLTTGASLLAPRPKVPSASTATTDRLQASIILRTPRTFVAGSTALATDVRDQEWATDQSTLDRFIVVASHRVRAIREIWFDDKMAWSSAGGVTSTYAGYLSVTPILEGSASNALYTSARMGNSRRYTGCAYVYLRYKLTGNSKKTESPFAGGSIPTRMTIVGDGIPVPDPRASGFNPADQATWSTDASACRNPALVMLAYFLGWRTNGKLAVGKGIPAARLDLASFVTAANICDEPVTRPNGTSEPRYRCDGIFNEGDETSLVLDNLKATMNAVLDDVDGKIRLSILYNDLATPIGDLTTADVLGEYTWDQTAPLSDSVNVIRGGYTDPSTTSLYQVVDYPEVRIASTDGIDRVQTINLPLVQSAGQAQRLAKLRLARFQFGGTFTAVFQATAWKFQKGDVIRFTFYPLGWSQKLFRIADMAIQVDGTVPMMLREEDPAIYAAYSNEAAAIQGVTPTAYDPQQWPVIQGLIDLDAQIARAVSDGWLDPSEKRQAKIDYDQRTAQRDALQTRYMALGSPSTVTAARDNAFAKVQSLYDYLQGLSPSWLDYSSQSQVPDPAAYQAAWKAASDALEAFGAAITGQKGDKGDSAYTPLSSNEIHQLPADAAGNVTSYTGAETTLKILLGTADVTSQFDFAVQANPQALTITNSAPRFIVTGGFDGNEPVASVTYRATGKSGTASAGVVIDFVFSLSKSLPGANGAPPPLISASASSDVAKYNANDQMVTGDITVVTVRSNSAEAPRFTLTSYDGTVHGNPNATAQQLKDSFGDQTFGTIGVDTLILRAAWLNTIMQQYGGGLRVAAGITGAADTTSIVKVRDGQTGDPGPSLTIDPSSTQLLVGKDGNYVSGQSFSLNVTRKNIVGVPVFQRSDGYSNTAAGFASVDPGSFSTSGPDNLTISAAGAVANMNAFGGTAGKLTFTASVPGSPLTATATIQRTTDGKDGADGYSVKAISNTYNVPFFATGAVRPDWQGGVGTIELRKGGTVITSGVTYAVESVTGVTSLTLSGNQYSFTGISTDKGGFTVVATYQGVQYRDVVSVKRTYDGSAAFNAGNPSVTGPSGIFDTVLASNKQVRVSASGFYDVTTGYGTWVGNMDLYYQNLTDGGAEVYAGNSVGSQASRFQGSGGAPGEPGGDTSNTGQVDRTVTFTTGNGNKTYRFRYVVNKTSGSNGVSVTHSGAIGVEVLA